MSEHMHYKRGIGHLFELEEKIMSMDTSVGQKLFHKDKQDEIIARRYNTSCWPYFVVSSICHLYYLSDVLNYNITPHQIFSRVAQLDHLEVEREML